MRNTWRTTDIYLEPHVVYRIYGEADSLLYIGVTIDFKARMQYHRAQSAWFPEYRRYELTDYPDRWQAESAEELAIADERPRHNKKPRKPWRVGIPQPIEPSNTPTSQVSRSSRS